MAFLQKIVDFFNHPFFILFSGFSVLVVIIGSLSGIYLWVKGILPVIVRLGCALAKRKVAIFGDWEAYHTLRSYLAESGIFKEKNILYIPLDNLEKARDKCIFLVDWKTAGHEINAILEKKGALHTAMIIYASPGSIPHDKMETIANKENTVVVNAKGRLLNDMLNCLITTSF